jgi:hypothetical protein
MATMSRIGSMATGFIRGLMGMRLRIGLGSRNKKVTVLCLLA